MTGPATAPAVIRTLRAHHETMLRRSQKVRSRRRPVVPTVVMLVLLALFPILQPNEHSFSAATTAIIYAIGAVGLDLIYGYAGQVSFGQFVYFGLGAYGMVILMTQLHVNMWTAVVIAVVLVAVIAGLVCLVLSRIGLLGAAIGSFFLAAVVVNLLAGNQLGSLTGGDNGLAVPSLTIGGRDLTDPHVLYYTSLIVLTAAALFVLRYVGVRSGLAAAVIKRNVHVAGVLGIVVLRERIKVNAIAAVFGALGGCLLAASIGFLSPETFNTSESVTLFAIVAVGGAGTVAGPILGALFYFALTELLSSTLAGGAAVAFSLALLAVVVYVNTGLYGFVARAIEFVRSALERRSALADRGDAPPSEEPVPDDASGPAPEPVEPEALAEALTAGDTDPTGGESLLAVRGLSVSFGGVRALDGVDLVAEAGKIHAVIGPNGAGKTTLLNCISGLQRPTSGTVVLGGRDVTAVAAAKRRQLGLGRTFQHPSLVPELDALTNVKVGGFRGRGRNLIAELAGVGSARRDDRLAVEHAERALALVGFPAQRWHVSGADLTMGDQKRIDIARGVAGSPQLLLVDEPTAGLGPDEIAGVVQVMNAVRSAGIGVLVIAHHVGFVRAIADTCTVLDFGRVIARGTPEEVMRHETVQQVFMGAGEQQ